MLGFGQPAGQRRQPALTTRSLSQPAGQRAAVSRPPAAGHQGRSTSTSRGSISGSQPAGPGA